MNTWRDLRHMGRKKSSNNYFTKETEEYIVRYNNSDDPEYRAKIFTDHIYYPFYKLVENLIHTFKFYYLDVDKLEDLKHEVITVLLEEKIHKFDPSVGAKAYSYFGTIAKRWLINYNNKNYKKLKRMESMSGFEESYEMDTDIATDDQQSLSTFIENWIEDTYKGLDVTFPKLSDRKIADAVLTVFKNRYDIDIYKKKALYIYIREMTDCKTPHLTRVISKLKEDFTTKRQKLYDLGLLTTVEK